MLYSDYKEFLYIFWAVYSLLYLLAGCYIDGSVHSPGRSAKHKIKITPALQIVVTFYIIQRPSGLKYEVWQRSPEGRHI